MTRRRQALALGCGLLAGFLIRLTGMKQRAYEDGEEFAEVL
jgi:hypothetical protein